MQLVVNNSLITKTPEEGRELAISLARTSVQAMQPDEGAREKGRAEYSTNAAELIAASHVVAVEFATIAAANNYWR